MVEVGVHEAKTTLSDLLRRVAAGEEITITRGGEPVARLVPVPQRAPRTLGLDRGLFTVPEDFDDPFPTTWWRRSAREIAPRTQVSPGRSRDRAWEIVGSSA